MPAKNDDNDNNDNDNANFSCSKSDPSSLISDLTGKDWIEIRHNSFHDCHDDYDFNLQSFILQWNPSTVIAFQRFLGRFKKEAKSKRLLYAFPSETAKVPENTPAGVSSSAPEPKTSS
eukprot:14779347-Ditylum_brightwellii.AAC.1